MTHQIMVVDDDGALRECICDVLEEDGFRCVPADSGAAALRRLRGDEMRPDVILLDLMMPGMNGWEFRAEQLRDPAIAHIPVVVMTASRDVEGITADEIVFKPLKLNKLIEVVRRHARPDGAPNGGRLSTPPGDARFIFGGGELGERMRALDWSTTPLGPGAGWPESLRSALSICLGSRFPIAIYWGSELTLLYNDMWSPIAGKKHPSALGKSAREVWPEIWDSIGPLFDRVLTTGEATYSEDALLPMRRHGYTEECYFNFTFSPIRGEAGRVEGVFNAVIETTYRVIAERRTRILRELGEAVSSARSAEAVAAAAVKVLGAAPRDVPFAAVYLGANEPRLVALAGPEALGGSAWPFTEAAATGKVWVVSDLASRLGFAPAGGAWPEPTEAASIAPLLVGGAPSGFLLLGANPRRAIDEESLEFVERVASFIANAMASAGAYEAERRRAEALAQLDRAKTAFFSNVSHEFRTPLTLMLGPTEDLLSGAHGPLTAEQRRELELLERNQLRLQRLVNSLLDFSRIEAGRVPASFEPVDLAALTADLAGGFRPAIERAGLGLVVSCPPLDGPIYVDRDLWEKIVLNLLSNALKFTFEGRIEVALRVEGTVVVVKIADTGVGIPAEELPRIFERFHRVEQTRARTHEGSGIGLALVQELVTLHGGAISVESRLGQGTSFEIRLPKGSAHLPFDRIVARAESSGAARSLLEEALRWSPAPVASPAGDDGRVLLAEDNADLRDYVARILAAQFPVEAVADGPSALEAARRAPPGLVLTDVMMPGLDGFGLLRALREDPRTAHVPVVMLSARAGEEARAGGVEAGADDYLVKPFSARELVARVRTHLELARLRRGVIVERDRLRDLLGGVPAIVNFLRGPELVFEYVHPLAARRFGPGAIVGRALGAGGPSEHVRRAFTSGERVEGSESDGDRVFRFAYVPVRDGGRFEGVMTFDLDVTEEARAQRGVEERGDGLRRLVTQLGAGVAQTDLAGRYTMANERYLEIVGRSAKELLQLATKDVTHPDDRSGSEELHARLVERGASFTIEKRYVRPDGSIVWVQNNVSRIEDSSGRPVGTAQVSLDITRRKFAERALREAERRFRSLVEATTQISWTTDREGRMREEQPSWSAFTGQGFEAYRGLGWLDAIDPEARAKTLAELERPRPAPFELEHRVRRHDGAYRLCVGRGVPVLDDAGRAIEWVGTHSDVTEQRALEDALRLNAERWATAQQAAAIGLYDWHPREHRIFWSDELRGLIGVDRQMVPSFELWVSRMHPDDRERAVDAFARATEARRESHLEECRMCLPGGSLRWIRTAQRIHYGADGRPERVIGAVVDVTQLKVAVESEREAREAAERAVRLSELFVGILGHDLRNPLSAIVTMAGLLGRRGAGDERIVHPAKRIVASADRMERMIVQLLDFTRIRIGRGLPLERAPVDLGELARATIDELEAVYARTIQLELRGAATGRWDRDRLSQLLSNLIANACQHGTPGTPVTILVDGTAPERVRFYVRNAGTVPPERLATLFEPLQTGPRGGGSSGLGLGLFISEQIVLAHGGRIGVASDGETCFSVELPR